MKLFIATISYKGSYFGGSAIRSVQASTKAVAQKRAEKFAAKEFAAFEQTSVVVEELTLAKVNALRKALEAVNEEYERIRAIKHMLEMCNVHAYGQYAI